MNKALNEVVIVDCIRTPMGRSKAGAFRHVGLSAYLALADKFAHLGPLYQVSEGLRQMAADHKKFYSLAQETTHE